MWTLEPPYTGGTVQTATAIVAIYAALVATASLAWQVYLWRHRRQTRLKVETELGFVTANVASTDVVDGERTEVVLLRAINHSDFPVRITAAGFTANDGVQIPLGSPRHGSSLPGRIEPHDSGLALVTPGELEAKGADLDEPMTAWVVLSTGERISAPPRPLLGLPAK